MEKDKKYWIDWCNKQKPFKLGDWCEPPIVSKEIYEEVIIPSWIEHGAIPKKDLIPGKTYLGHCRNASEAVWNGKEFTYVRRKFNITFPEDIEHFEDYTEYDVFVPLKLKEDEDSTEN